MRIIERKKRKETDGAAAYHEHGHDAALRKSNAKDGKHDVCDR